MVSPVIIRNRESNRDSTNGEKSELENKLVKDLFSKINLYDPGNDNAIDLMNYKKSQLLALKRKLSNQDELKKIIGQKELEKILKFKLVDEALVGSYADKSIVKFQSAESISSLWSTFAVVSTGPYGAILGFGAYHLFLSAPIGVIIGAISFVASLPMAINKYKSDKAKLKSMLEKMVIDELLVRVMQAIDIKLNNKIDALKKENISNLSNELQLLNESGLIEAVTINHANLFDKNGREINQLISQFDTKLSSLVSSHTVDSIIRNKYFSSLEKLKKLVNDTALFEKAEHSAPAMTSVGVRRQESVIIASPQVRAEENERFLVDRNTQVDSKNLKFSSYCKNNKMETAATLFGGVGTVGALSVITTLGVTALKVFGITTLLGISLVSLPVMITLFSVSVVAAAGICAFNLYNRKKQWQREQKAYLINQQKTKLSDDYENKKSVVDKLKKMASEFKTIFDITKEIKDKEESNAMKLVPTELRPVSTSTYIYQLPVNYMQTFGAQGQSNSGVYFEGNNYRAVLESVAKTINNSGENNSHAIPSDDSNDEQSYLSKESKNTSSSSNQSLEADLPKLAAFTMVNG